MLLAGRSCEDNKACCILSIREKVPPCSITEEEASDSKRVLEYQYDLLEHIFAFLGGSDLRSASLVNSFWSKAAKRELQKRTSAALLSCVITRLCQTYTFNSIRYSDVAFCFFAYQPLLCDLKAWMCVHHNDSVEKMTFAEYLEKEAVPNSSSVYCAVACTEVVSPEHSLNVMFQGIFLPRIPNIRIVLYHGSPTQIDGFDNSNEQLKCLLLFTKKYQAAQAQTFLRKVLNSRSYTDVALGGGLIKGAKTFRHQLKQRVFKAGDFLCVGFMEAKNVPSDFNAYSVVIPGLECEPSEIMTQFEKEIATFKNKIVLRKDGAVFRFCCFAKYYKEVENVVLQKYFPQYPVFGMELDGEIGWNTMDVTDAESMKSSPPKKLKRSNIPKTLHGWTSILVVITWGKIL